MLLSPFQTAVAEAQPATRVVDLNTTRTFFRSGADGFAALGSTIFFTHNDGTTGDEIWSSDGTDAGTRLVKDVCPGICPSYPHFATVSNGLLYFGARNGAHGPSLWRTDGTAAGTLLVADLQPGLTDHVFAGAVMDAGDVLFFTRDDGEHGVELWVTDGTVAGTRLVKDIYPGPDQFFLYLLAGSEGRLLFGVYDPAQGLEPWISDGTEEGTVPLGDLNPGEPSSLEGAAIAFQDGFLFSANDGVNGFELWRTDGTPAGTALLKDIRVGSPTDSRLRDLTLFQGEVYFAAADERGYELWKTDGTPAGTVLVKDILPGIYSSDPRELTPAGNRLYFRADDGVHGNELWTSDGTTAGTSLVADLTPYDSFSDPLNGFPNSHWFSALGNDLIFLIADGFNGPKLWKSDGTAAGTVQLVSNVHANINSLRYNRVAGGLFYFGNPIPGSPGSSLDLWATDGTGSGTHPVKSFVHPPPAFYISNGRISERRTFGALGNVLLFQGNDGSGAELWRSDGTADGTWLSDRLVDPAFVFGSHPREIHSLGNQAVFIAAGRVWVTEGIPGKAHPLTPPDVSPQGNFAPSGGSFFFAASSFAAPYGHEIWRTDGTLTGTVKLIELTQSDNQIVTVQEEMVESGGKVFFTALINGFSDSSLWRFDPQTNEVTRLSHIYGADPKHLIDLGGTLFFTRNFSFIRTELWKSDGSEAGTVRVADVGVGSSDSTGHANYGELAGGPGGFLFFSGDDGQSGLELWKSDGTEAGTVQIADICPGACGSEPRWLTLVGDQVYFVADDGVHGRELWVSDGTEAGTRMVADVLPGEGSSLPGNLAALGSTLLFSAFDGVHGVEPWRTGGSVLGTRRISDIAPGALSSSPMEFTAAGPNVYFAADDNTTGFELWAVPKASVLATFGDVPTTYWAWPSIEALATAGLTLGCNEGLYCPTRLMTRAEAAVFLVRGIHGSGFIPPAPAGTVFADVPAGYWAASWIEQLAADGITTGCGASQFCPEGITSRDQMAVFLLRAIHGSGYTPPPATGTAFTDVPASHWAAAWIEQLAAEGITSGCAPNRYCPGDPISRDQMAVFLTRAFSLPLP